MPPASRPDRERDSRANPAARESAARLHQVLTALGAVLRQQLSQFLTQAVRFHRVLVENIDLLSRIVAQIVKLGLRRRNVFVLVIADTSQCRPTKRIVRVQALRINCMPARSTQ